MNSCQSLGLCFGLYYVFMYLFSPLIHNNNKNNGDNNNNKNNNTAAAIYRVVAIFQVQS